jgi:hypothetical protein
MAGSATTGSPSGRKRIPRAQLPTMMYGTITCSVPSWRIRNMALVWVWMPHSVPSSANVKSSEGQTSSR